MFSLLKYFLITLLLTFNPPKDINPCLDKSIPLVIVHVESQFDGAARVAQEITIIANDRINIYLLKDSSEDWLKTTEVPEVNPQTISDSPAGVNDIKLKENQVIVTGGYFRACFKNAIVSLTDSNNSKELEVIIPMKAVYFGEKRTLYEYYLHNYKSNWPDFKKYMDEVIKTQFKLDKYELKLIDDNLLSLKIGAK